MPKLSKEATDQLELPELPPGYFWKLTRGTYPMVYVRRKTSFLAESMAMVSVRNSYGGSLQERYQDAIADCYRKAKANIKRYEQDQAFLKGKKQ